MWITLAPYFLPTLSLLLLPVSFALPGSYEPVLFTFVGATLVYHVLSTWSELRVMQSDFRKAGVLQSIWLLPVANLVSYGSIIAFVLGDFNGLSHFWRASSKNVLKLIAAFVSYLVGGNRSYW
jgi:hypothetical protein